MIDTDKYEGHTPAPWRTGGSIIQAIQIWTVDGLDETGNWIQSPRADRLLAADAPLLLAEVKRLREQLGRYTQFVLWGEEEHNEVFDEYEGKVEL